MENLSKKKALITGASSGIGRAMAISLGKRGCELFLVARRSEKLDEVIHEIKELDPKVIAHKIVLDITDSNATEVISEITEKKVDILINNAGLALGREKIQDANFADFEGMIQTNVIANFKLVHLVVPWMLENGGGDIINLCSIAGHYTYPGGGVYAATKHAVNAFTRVLREETCGKNLRVMQISPGMVDTEFSTVRYKGDTKAADAVYANMVPLHSEDIARMMTFMLEQPRHVVIDEMITTPIDQGSATTISRRHP